MSDKIYAANVFTIKEGASIDELIDLIKEGVETTSSKNDGFATDTLYKSADGKTALNFSEWNGDINLFMSNHQKNETNPTYHAQMEAVGKIADYAPMAYFKVFSLEKKSEIAETEILAVESALTQAVLKKDAAALLDLLTDDFYAVGYAGNVVDKAEYGSIHLSPERKFIKFETADQVVKVYGETAIVYGKSITVNELLAQNPPPKTYTTIYRNINGSWKIAGWQETPVTTDKF